MDLRPDARLHRHQRQLPELTAGALPPCPITGEPAAERVEGVPANLANLPPRHLTWWNEGACRAPAARLGVAVVRVGPLPACRAQAIAHWTRLLCALRARPGGHGRAGWRWHASAGLAFGAARLLAPLLGPPPGARPLDILLVARKAG